MTTLPALPPVPAPIWLNATVLSIHDGDTFDVRVSWGKRRYDEPQPIRLLGCNAIELDDPGGHEARDNLAALLPAGSPVVLLTNEDDKFAPRWDCSVAYVPAPAAGSVGVVHDLVTDLVLTNWAVPWNGRGPRPLPPWPRPRVTRQERIDRLGALDRAVREWRMTA